MIAALVVFFGGILALTASGLLSDEIRGCLDLIPHFILRLAAAQLFKPGEREVIYEEEWLPELIWALRNAESRPITRLILGIKYSIGHLISARRTARHLAARQSARQLITPPNSESTTYENRRDGRIAPDLVPGPPWEPAPPPPGTLRPSARRAALPDALLQRMQAAVEAACTIQTDRNKEGSRIWSESDQITQPIPAVRDSYNSRSS